MTPLQSLRTHWPAIDALLDEALTLPPAQRAAWLDRLPPEHAALRDTLARLLAADAAGPETGEFLRTLPPAAGAAAAMADPPAADAPAAGAVVGPWRLLAPLGDGGMGSVWRAERADASLKRPVALKLPRLAWAAGLAERMARERDILASLDHAHIARLHDAGVDAAGRPWLALELVDGEPIDAFARGRGLSVRARVALLRQVCDAVAYAHARLVIHRDLKPSNILVTADGRVKLLDFGIAKLTDGAHAQETQLTRAAGRALTPDYASPEQVRGEPLGTASDVYSLGVVAYELLAGQRPYRVRRGGAAALEEAIEQAGVPAASSVAPAADRRALQGDLDAILWQALRKEPARRYATVQQLDDDLRRHLADEPVTARPEAWAPRAWRFVRRHRGAVAAGTLVAGALVAGAGVAAWQAGEARAQAQRADAARRLVLSVFAETDVQQGTSRQTTAVELLDRVEARIGAQRGLDPATATELQVTVARSRAGLADFAGAIRQFEAAEAAAKARLGDDAPPVQALRAHLAYALTQDGRLDDARRILDRALPVLERDPRIDPEALVRGWNTEMLLRSHASDGPGTLAAAQQAVELADRHLEPDHPLRLAMRLERLNAMEGWDHPDLEAEAGRTMAFARATGLPATAPMMLSARHLWAYNQASTPAVRDELLALVRDASAALGDHPQVASMRQSLANVLADLGDTAGAVEQARLATRTEDGANPKTPTYERAFARLRWAHALIGDARPADAVPIARDGVDLLAAALGDDNPMLAVGRTMLALALADAGRVDEAGAVLDAVRPVLAAGADPNTLVRAARVERLRGRPDAAVALARQAVERLGERSGTAGERSGARAQLAAARLEAGDAPSDDLLGPLREAVARQGERPVNPAQARQALDLARAELARGPVGADAAEAAARRALAYWLARDVGHREAGLAWHAVGSAAAAAGRAADARAALARARTVLGAAPHPAERRLAWPITPPARAPAPATTP